MTLDQILADAQIDLDDLTHGQSFSQTEMIEFVNQEYLDWCVYTRCIVKTVQNQSWWAGPYLNFTSLYTDAIGIISILNNLTTRYLFDFANREDMYKIRIDFEKWSGTPFYWFPVSVNYIGVAPNFVTNPSGTYDICYYAFPSPLALGDSPLFASDMHYALRKGAVARALESVEEFTKATSMWGEYYPLRESFKKRVSDFHKAEFKRVMGF